MIVLWLESETAKNPQQLVLIARSLKLHFVIIQTAAYTDSYYPLWYLQTLLILLTPVYIP